MARVGGVGRSGVDEFEPGDRNQKHGRGPQANSPTRTAAPQWTFQFSECEPMGQRPPWIDSRVEVTQKRPQEGHHEPEIDPDQHRADTARTCLVSTAREGADAGQDHERQTQEPQNVESSQADGATSRAISGTVLEPGPKPDGGQGQERDDQHDRGSSREKGQRYRKVEAPTNAVGDQTESNQGVTSISTM